MYVKFVGVLVAKAHERTHTGAGYEQASCGQQNLHEAERDGPSQRENISEGFIIIIEEIKEE